MTDAFKGFTFKKGDGASPIVYTAVGEVKSVSGVGLTNALLDVTSADSGNTREFIAGMADGAEITVECNYVSSNTQQAALITAVGAGSNGNVELTLTNGTVSPNVGVTVTMTVTFLSWQMTPGYDDANGISFTMKISGTPTVATF